MKFTVFKASVIAAIAAIGSSTPAPQPDSLPWANANPHAGAAAQAFADAYAEAIAISHPDPEAYAMAASADDCATIACHAACGMLIISGSDCTTGEDDYTGPYAPGCLCGSDSTPFLSYYDECLECGWTLWKYYSGYVQEALAACSAEDSAHTYTEPTGTLRCSTTLTDVYTVDPDINYSTYIN